MAKYSKEERDRAVELAQKIGVPAASTRTGIKTKTIYSWLERKTKKAQILNEKGEVLSPEAMVEQIRELEKEIKQLQRDNDILVEALNFFRGSTKNNQK